MADIVIDVEVSRLKKVWLSYFDDFTFDVEDSNASGWESDIVIKAFRPACFDLISQRLVRVDSEC